MGSQMLKLRPATLRDLDTLTVICCTAMPMDPEWDYRFPYRKRFPEDNFCYRRKAFERMLESKSILINVVTFPSPGVSEEDWAVGALAVWDLEPARVRDHTRPSGMSNHPYPHSSTNAFIPVDGERRDANFEHMAAFSQAVSSAQKSYFNDVYGSQQVHLRVLATHPDYQRRGAGTLHCKWGMELAKARKQPITVFGSPMGQRLYYHLGFDHVGNATVQVEGEEEYLTLSAMIYPFKE